MSIYACAGNAAAFGWVGHSDDNVTVQFKVGNIATRFCHGKGIGGLVRDDRAVFRPINKGVARVGHSGQDGRCVMPIDASACHRSALGRIGFGDDVVAVRFEVGDVVASPRYDEAVIGIRRNHHAVFRPVDKVVAFIRRGRQGDGRTMQVASRTIHRAGFLHISRYSNIVRNRLWREVSHVGTRLGDAEAIDRLR